VYNGKYSLSIIKKAISARLQADGDKESTFLIRLSRRHFSSGSLLLLAGLALFALWSVRLLHSENFVLYLPNQRRLIPLWMAGNIPYLPVLPVLELTGQVGVVVQKRSSIEVFVGTVPLKLRRNQTKVTVGSYDIILQQPILEANGQWLAPTTFLSAVMPALVGQQIVYQPGTNRAFLGGVRPISFTVRLQNLAAGVRLIVSFTGPVAIQTAASNGEWVVFLGGAPVQPLEQDFFLQNPYLIKVRFDDQDGRPKLILTPGAGGLDFYPRLSGGGETLVTDVVSPKGPLGVSPLKTPHPITPPVPPAAAPGAPATPPLQPAPALPSVVLDAGHGGRDPGAHSEDGILEKNLTAQLAAWADSYLSGTKQYRVVLTRPGDTDPDFEQRTVIANTARPVAFISFHAGELGGRSPVVVIYTYAPPSPPPGADPVSPSPLFVPWELAQTTQQARSEALAQDLQQSFSKIPGIAAVQTLRAPVRQLRSLDAPAVAVEVGTLTPSASAGDLSQPDFQKQVAGAVVSGLLQFTAKAGKS
jgi:N-acetylmuramoyl-L-alanine amidase